MNNNRARLRVARVVRELFQSLRIAAYASMSTGTVDGSPVLRQPLLAMGAGRIKVGVGVQIGYFPSPYFFSTNAYIEARNPEAEVVIGDGTVISNNFSAIAEGTMITIGKRCVIGPNVSILDSDFHALRAKDRRSGGFHAAEPVLIGDEVFFGADVTVLKGVTIGNGAVIGSCAVVTKDVPADGIAVGNPAKIVKLLE